MAELFPRLVALLARLEDELPYVTVDDLCERAAPTVELTACQDLVAEGIAGGQLFTDARQRLDAESGAVQLVRLVRLNRRHPAVAPILDA